MGDRDDDETRLRRMWDAHHGAVLAYCRRRAEADVASEVAVEVFAVAWRRLEIVPDKPRAWLLGVARRTLANHRRADARHARLLDRLRERAAPEVRGPSWPMPASPRRWRASPPVNGRRSSWSIGTD